MSKFVGSRILCCFDDDIDRILKSRFVNINESVLNLDGL